MNVPVKKARILLAPLLTLLFLPACGWFSLPPLARHARPASLTPSPSAAAWLAWTRAPAKSTASPKPPTTLRPAAATAASDTSAPQPTLPPLACLPPDSETTYARALWASSGDTIVVEIEGAARSVHYLGVRAAPARPSPAFFGPPAATQNAGWIAGQVVQLIQDGDTDRDALGRLERYVILNDTGLFLNYEMIRTGLAEYDPDSPAQACGATLEQAQQTASLEQLGRWEPQPTFEAALPASPAETAVPSLPSSSPAPNAGLTLTSSAFFTPGLTSLATATSPPGGTFVPSFSTATPSLSPTLSQTPSLTPSAGPLPTITFTRGPDCDAAYPDVCIMSPPPYLNCEDIPYDNFVVLPPDPHDFDWNENGIGCESGE